MTDFQLQTLKETYQNYLNGRNSTTYYYDSVEDKKRKITQLQYLEDKGLIDTKVCSGYTIVMLSSYGVDFVENDFQEPNITPVVTQGNNCILINGNANSVSDNYNHISNDIDNADLPSEYKELMNTLLYELKNPALSQDKKSNKIKDFLSEITSNSLSTVASSSLTVLISSLLNQIPF